MAIMSAGGYPQLSGSLVAPKFNKTQVGKKKRKPKNKPTKTQTRKRK